MNEFDKRFSERLSKSLEQALGDKIVSVVYSMLKSDFGIEKENVPEHPEALKKVLRKIFGATGMDFLEMLISKEILVEFDLPFELDDDNIVLAKALKKARKVSLSSEKRNRT